MEIFDFRGVNRLEGSLKTEATLHGSQVQSGFINYGRLRS